MEPVLATIPEGRAVFLTIDADGLDPTEMPAVMAPTPGGLYFRQVAPLLRAVARRNRIIGMDLVEVAPALRRGVAGPDPVLSFGSPSCGPPGSRHSSRQPAYGPETTAPSRAWPHEVSP